VTVDPLSFACTVTVSVCREPAVPKNVPLNWQMNTPPAESTKPLEHDPRPARLP
jgi:hypothetical protein